jgi:hypothetical protein
MIVTVSRKDITIRQRVIEEGNLFLGVRTYPGAWEVQFAGRLSTGEWVETAEYVDADPVVALKKLEYALQDAGWEVVD